MPSVIRIADKIVYLREGTVYWTGTPEELLHSEDPVLKKFLYGDSGEDWASLAGMHENFQRVLAGTRGTGKKPIEKPPSQHEAKT